MSKKQLHLGIMTNEELAAWFGITLASFKNQRTKKLEELKSFADYDNLHGKVDIKQIYLEEYSKKGSKALQKIESELDEVWSSTGLDSCSRVKDELVNKYGSELGLKPSSIYNYTRKARKELYGVPFTSDGKLGSCSYLWCKKYGDGATAILKPFTPEENKVKEELIKKHFGNTTEKQVIVQRMIESGEITKEEAWDVLDELTGVSHNFYSFLLDLQERLGVNIIKGTMVERGVYKELPAWEGSIKYMNVQEED